MKLLTERYIDQVKDWPKSGRHILAHYDDSTIIVYQAYRPSIGNYALRNGHFGGDFSYSRMSWIKPNFLWMMYRSGWGTKQGQEVILGLRLRREFFDQILAQSVQSSYYEGHFATRELWQEALAQSSVRLQWDPDHHPSGAKLERRAVQLGLRGPVLAAFGEKELIEVIDMSEFVATQRPLTTAEMLKELQTPVERVYIPSDPEIGRKLGLTTYDPSSAPKSDIQGT